MSLEIRVSFVQSIVICLKFRVSSLQTVESVPQLIALLFVVRNSSPLAGKNWYRVNGVLGHGVTERVRSKKIGGSLESKEMGDY